MIYQVECNSHHVRRCGSLEEALASIPGVKDGKGNWVAHNPHEMDGKDIWCITVDGYRIVPSRMALQFLMRHKYAGLSVAQALGQVPRAIYLSLDAADREFLEENPESPIFDAASACLARHKRAGGNDHLDALTRHLSPTALQALVQLRRQGYACGTLGIIERALLTVAGGAGPI